MNGICLIFDRLSAGCLGAYGNAWIDTPAVDRLAAQSFLFDQALIDTPDLERLYRSYWQGRHGLCLPETAESPSLLALLREQGVRTALLTDERLVARHPLAVDFDEIVEIDPPWQPQPAGEIEETHFAKCFLPAIEWLQSAREPFLLWCHLGGLGASWDAPHSFRQMYREEGDPEPPEGAETPDRMLPESYHPDELLGVTHSYAAQVSLLDTCLEGFLDFVEGLTAAEGLLLAMTSSRGFPLGEHRRLGPCDNALYGELVHVPLLLRFPDNAGAAARSQALVEPADLWATLGEWWKLPTMPASPTAASLMPLVRQEAVAWRDRLCVAGRGIERAIRTPAWYLRTAEEAELYAKPDDRWEVNDVANRCREVAECLQDAVQQYERTLSGGRIADLPPLSEVLVEGLG